MNKFTQIHTLEIDDFSDDNYVLLGIHTALEEHKLAYLLNQCLETTFKRAAYDLDFENKNNNAFFAVYEYENSSFSEHWFLIKNQCVSALTTTTTGFFETNTVTSYLIPELKKVDFFLKLEGDFDNQYLLKIIDQISSINQVITSYQVFPDSLKSKEFLIF